MQRSLNIDGSRAMALEGINSLGNLTFVSTRSSVSFFLSRLVGWLIQLSSIATNMTTNVAGKADRSSPIESFGDSSSDVGEIFMVDPAVPIPSGEQELAEQANEERP